MIAPISRFRLPRHGGLFDLLEPELPPATPPPPTVPRARDHVSYSSLRTYQQCSLRYYFKYVAQLPEESVSASFVFGRAIHAAIEFHFQSLLAEDEPPSLERLLEHYQQAWREQPLDSVIFGKSESPQSCRTLAERMLIAFQVSEAATPPGRIIGVEEELRGELIADAPPLLARLDLLSEAPDAIVITDFKTSRSAWSSEQVEESAGQLYLYSELVRRLLSHKPLRLEFIVATKGKEVSVTRHAVPCRERQIARTLHIADLVWQGISEQRFMPSPSVMNCATCPYREPCRRWPN